MITVLICVHSRDDLHDKLFGEALDSLLAQTYKEFKTVIVFDECWDNTYKVAEKLTNYIQVIKTPKTGLSDAKNEGIRYINTDWVAFLDADDMWLPEKLEKQVKHLQNADIISTHYWFRKIGDKEEITESCFSTKDYVTHDQIAARLPVENCLCHGSILMKRSIFDKVKYGNHKGIEDWVLWKDCLALGYRFYQLPERLYVYTTNTSVER
jgi:glycosyltransferase involved in cell wall biosynthesis